MAPVIVCDGEVIAVAVAVDDDPSAHAEFLAIQGLKRLALEAFSGAHGLRDAGTLILRGLMVNGVLIAACL